MWLRTDLAPATDQIATLRVDNGSGTWDVPVFDASASTTNVEKVLRIPVGGTVGFVPTTSSGGAFSDLRLQHSGSTLQWHDSLEASVIPDSVVIQNYATTWTQGDGTWADDATADGAQDMSITGDPQDGTLSDGAEALDWDGVDDYGATTLPSSLEGGGLTEFSVEATAQWTFSGSEPLFGSINNDGNQMFKLLVNLNEQFNTDNGTFMVQLFDDARNRWDFSPSSNPNLDDGNRHDISVIIDDSTTNSATVMIDGSSVSLATNRTENPSSFTTWDNPMFTASQNNQGSPSGYFDGPTGAFRWHDSAISQQTIGDYS